MKSTAITTLLIACSLTACDVTKLSNWDEWKCLNSERLRFKDPDAVLFIANLGDRQGGKLETNKFWIRYKAKNSYGAFIQANMACHRGAAGEWERDSFAEQIALIRTETSILRSRNKLSWEERRDAPLSDAARKDMAYEQVYTSPDNLPSDAGPESSVEKHVTKTVTAEPGQGFLEIPFGADEATILAKLGSQVEKLPEPDIFYYAYANYVMPEYVIGGVPMKVSFQMNNETHLLDQVLLSKSTNDVPLGKFTAEFNTLSSFFTAKYGTPSLTTETPPSLPSKLWLNGATTMNLSYYQSKTIKTQRLTLRYFRSK